MQTSMFDYHLPSGRIAQVPASPRDSSRLLVFNRKTKKVIHDRFKHLTEYLRSGDVLVFNDTKVFPARLHGQKSTGGQMEVFLLRPLIGNAWEVLIGGKVRRIGLVITFKLGLRCEVVRQLEGGVWHVRFNKAPQQVLAIADKIGSTPTPPYIKKTASMADYQTVYAKKVGSVAAPTAGFHFTKRLLAQLKKKGVQFEFVTLHVGLGTFQPVKVEDIRQHKMHAEYAEISKNTLNHLRQAKKEGRRIIAVGTTSVRVLETVYGRWTTRPLRIANQGGRADYGRDRTVQSSKFMAHGFRGWINTFIYPGYRFKIVDAMITNFHLPKSTLLMLVAAFLSERKRGLSPTQTVERLQTIYQIAIREQYRFYSFGDGMLIE
ncbi:MAG: tRNA preQ1(34) S-adenosylmethionine ribosyltransferase-isomerase QueA [Patescibacteria group bacterium]